MRPPKILVYILERIIQPKDRESLPGDFAEIYNVISDRSGRISAFFWYLFQVAKLMPSFYSNSILWSIIMFENYLKIAFRNLRKHKGYSFINIAGLSIGMACCVLILLFVQFEFSFDKFHEKKASIYRVLWQFDSNGEPVTIANTPLPLAPALNADFPEIAYTTRISRTGRSLFSVGDNQFYESMIYADSDLFDIFTFPLLRGDAETALADPFSIVITQEMAAKYLGHADPIGKTITIQNSQDYKVTGIFNKIPDNSHLSFEALASFSSRNNDERVKGNYWDRIGDDYTYILLSENANPKDLKKKSQSFIEKYISSDGGRHDFYLQPLPDIYFSKIRYDSARTGDLNYIYAFSAIAFFILLIASINFMNLATARSAGRAKEVGLRKVVGANRIQLIRQFLSESMFLALLSLIVATGLVYAFLPGFGHLIRRELSFNFMDTPLLILILLGMSLCVGVLSGSYPALFLSAFRPVRVLKGAVEKKAKGFNFRTLLVVLQFAISIVLIIATTIVYDQLNFMKSKDLGFDGEQIAVIPMRDRSLRNNYETFKNKVLQEPSVISASASNGAPASDSRSTRGFNPEGFAEDAEMEMLVVFADYDFIETFGLELIEGRNFSKTFATDANRGAYILNETAVKEIGWDSPVGKRLTSGSGQEGTVVGIVKDFHLDSVRDEIAPLVITIDPAWFYCMSVKMRPENISSTLTFLENKWNDFAKKYPFEYAFIDENFERYYQFEQRLGRIFTYCSMLAIFISCLGIFGLASFATEQRTKEIGMRKVLGASVPGIVSLISKDFVKWVLVANIIAWPVAYFVMSRWLQDFAYRTNMTIWTFLFSTILALLIALLTVSYQAVKAAVANPVDALKYE